jgi:hypothetical protein
MALHLPFAASLEAGPPTERPLWTEAAIADEHSTPELRIDFRSATGPHGERRRPLIPMYGDKPRGGAGRHCSIGREDPTVPTAAPAG